MLKYIKITKIIKIHLYYSYLKMDIFWIILVYNFYLTQQTINKIQL